jgi:CDP-4-dehydro-6-deoxyglucose reductase/ferredoxin-NAD(P)+ reductase (naphthalene dioxygenase ferredoxin-specific)
LTAQPDTSSQDTPRRYTGTIAAVEAVAADTCIFKVMVADQGRIPFRAGQYAMLYADGLEPRAFSIASAPHLPFVEFHIKNTGHGISGHIFQNWKEGGEITFEAPFGDHYWRASSRPLLALAGGVGIAPLKAIIEAHFDHAAQSPAHLYWGVRDEAHLYLDGFFRGLQKAHAQFHYVPLLAQGDGKSRIRTGFTGPSVAKDFPTLAGFNIYMAGPAAMVEATLPLLLKHGAEKDFIYSDAFGP